MTSIPARTARAYTPGVLLLTAALTLTAMYYFARPDAVGVFSPLRGWRIVTPGVRGPLVHFAASAVLLAVIPVVVARWLCGIRLRDLGLGLGSWRRGLGWLAVGLPLAVLAGWMASRQPAMQAVYPLDPSLSRSLAPRAGTFLPYAACAFLYYGGWEVLFRGVLLYGLAARFGAGNANVTQSALATTAHFGRAFNETFAALPGSLAFGVVALHTRSIWYVALIHWTVGMSTEWFMLVR
jgi:membrane protease YdiL (CAAX protease family)